MNLLEWFAELDWVYRTDKEFRYVIGNCDECLHWGPDIGVVEDGREDRFCHNKNMPLRHYPQDFGCIYWEKDELVEKNNQ